VPEGRRRRIPRSRLPIRRFACSHSKSSGLVVSVEVLPALIVS
jgi:hypothetical protein